jgi:putative glutamine amidotransferase
MTRPRILITLDTGEELRRGVSLPIVTTKLAYVRAVEEAGGLPLLIAPSGEESAEAFADLLDGLVITGGAFDIEPERYGATAAGARLDAPKPTRTRFEEAILRLALELGRPVLAICGGMQLLNIVRGGTLLVDIKHALKDQALEHEQPTSPAEPWHEVRIEPGSALERLAGGQHTIRVNSTHHQAVDKLGADLDVLGRSPDGVIEAIGLAGEPCVIGVQWHPELQDDELSRALYRCLVEAAEGG